MTRSVQYSQNGDIDQLHIVEKDSPAVGPGEVRVAVRYAGLNPVDRAVISGEFGEATGPKGNGADFSGVVDGVGEGSPTSPPETLSSGAGHTGRRPHSC